MATDLSMQSRAPKAELARRFDGWSMDRAIAVGVTVALAAVFAQAVAQIVDFAVYDLRIGALNSDVHASIFGVMSLVAQGVVAVVAGFRGLHSDQRARWFVLAALAAGLVVVRAALPGSAAAFAVPCAAVFVLVWSLTSADPVGARTVVRASLYLLVFSFVIHVVELALGNVGTSWPDEIKCLFKHSAELSGWILLATGIVAGMSPGRTRAVS